MPQNQYFNLVNSSNILSTNSSFADNKNANIKKQIFKIVKKTEIIKPNSTYMVYTGFNKIIWVWFLVFFPSILYFKNNLYAVIFLSLLMVIAILLIQLLTIYHIFIYDKDDDYIGTSKGDRIEFEGMEFQEKGYKVTITSVSTPIEFVFVFKKDKENFVNFLNKKHLYQ